MVELAVAVLLFSIFFYFFFSYRAYGLKLVHRDFPTINPGHRNYEDFCRLYRRVLKKNTSAIDCIRFANLCYENSYFATAKEYYTKIYNDRMYLELDDNIFYRSLAMLRLSLLFLREKNYVDAKAFLLELKPYNDSYDLNNSLGFIYFLEHNYQKAEEHLKKVYDVFLQSNIFSDINSIKYLVISYYYLENFKSAISILKRLEPVNVRDEQLDYYSGLTYFEIGDYNKAKSLLVPLTNFNQFKEGVSYVFASLMMNEGNYFDAISEFNKILFCEVHDLFLLKKINYNLAMSYKNCGEYFMSYTRFKESLDSGVEYKDSRDQIIELAEIIGKNKYETIYSYAKIEVFSILCNKIIDKFVPGEKRILKYKQVDSNKFDFLVNTPLNFNLLFRFDRGNSEIFPNEINKFLIEKDVSVIDVKLLYYITNGDFSDESKAIANASFIKLINKDALNSIFKEIVHSPSSSVG